MKHDKKSSTGGGLRPPQTAPWGASPPQTPLRFLRGQAPSNSPLNYENKKEPQRSQESFGGSFASRSLTGVEKQRIWYSVKTPLLGGDGGGGDGGGGGRISKSDPAPFPSRPGMEYRVRLPLTPI